MSRHPELKVSCEPNKVELEHVQDTDIKRMVLLCSAVKYLWLLHITFYGYTLYHPRRNLYFSVDWTAIKKCEEGFIGIPGQKAG